MASLPYMQFYVADYLADTRHLSTLQHGIYLLLIMNYWQTAKPLPDDPTKLARIVGMRPQDFLKHYDSVISFFEVVELKSLRFLVHHRIDRDLEAAHQKSLKASTSGRQRGKKNINGTANAEQTLSHNTKQDYITPKPPQGAEGGFKKVVEAYQAIQGALVNFSQAEKLWRSMELESQTDLILQRINEYKLTAQWQREAIPNLGRFLKEGFWKMSPKLAYGAKSGIYHG